MTDILAIFPEWRYSSRCSEVERVAESMIGHPLVHLLVKIGTGRWLNTFLRCPTRECVQLSATGVWFPVATELASQIWFARWVPGYETEFTYKVATAEGWAGLEEAGRRGNLRQPDGVE